MSGSTSTTYTEDDERRLAWWQWRAINEFLSERYGPYWWALGDEEAPPPVPQEGLREPAPVDGQ